MLNAFFRFLRIRIAASSSGRAVGDALHVGSHPDDPCTRHNVTDAPGYASAAVHFAGFRQNPAIPDPLSGSG